MINYFSKINKRNILISSIFFVALILKITFFQGNLPLHNDENVYHYSALNLLKYNVFTMDREGYIYNEKVVPKATAIITPGYSIFITLIYSLFNNSTYLVKIANVLMSMFSLYMIFIISKELNLRKISIYSVLIVASVYPGFIYNNSRVLTENIFGMLLLVYAYFFLKTLRKYNIKDYILASFFLTLAIYVKPIAVLFMIISTLFIILQKIDLKTRIRFLMAFWGIFVIIMLPWWIRNYILFNKFIIFSEAGQNVVTWGALPYFIGIFEVGNASIHEIVTNAYNANPIVYMKWRIFGFFQYMWGDIWDENLVHPYVFLKKLLFLHHLIIVPSLVLIPLIFKRLNIREIFIINIPIVFTVQLLVFHGLPRYVWPSIPFVIIMFGILIHKSSEKYNKNDNRIVGNISLYFEKMIRKSYLLVWSLFSIILFYSVYIFPFTLSEEMSNYRLSRYMGIQIQDVKSLTLEETKEYNLKDKNLIIKNCSKEERDNKIIFKNNWDTSAILLATNLTSLDSNSSKFVTKVIVNSQGGYLLDYMTIYWKEKNQKDFSESKVYKFPINPLQRQQIVYIDANVDELMIAPIVLWNGEFEFNNIVVEKYKI